MYHPHLRNPSARALIDRFSFSADNEVALGTVKPSEDSFPITELLIDAGARLSRAVERNIRGPEDFEGRILAAMFLEVGGGAIIPAQLLPKNLYRLYREDDILNRVYNFIETQPIPLHTIPDHDIARELLAATSEDERKAVVLKHESKLLEICDQLIAQADSQLYCDEIKHYVEARFAFDASLYRATQTTIAGLIDACMYRRERDTGVKRKLALSHGRGQKDQREAILDDMVVSEYVVWRTVWNAYSEFRGHENELPPTIFNRHACAHSVNSCQYSRANAIIGLMIAVTVVKLLDDC